MVAGTRVVALRKRRDWKALFFLKFYLGGFPGGLVVICLCQSRRQVRSLIWEDLTGHGKTKPVHHNY